MSDLIYNLFKYLTDVTVNIVSVNIWLYLLLVTAPLLAFAARPNSHAGLRIGRLVMAIAFTYVLANLALHTDRAFGRKAYEHCRSESQFRIDSPAMYEECKHHINIADGASNFFYLYLGWAPALVYVGLWELAWRLRHRKAIRSFQRRDLGLTISSILVVTALSILLFLLAFLIYSTGGWRAIIVILALIIALIEMLFPNSVTKSILQSMQDMFMQD